MDLSKLILEKGLYEKIKKNQFENIDEIKKLLIYSSSITNFSNKFNVISTFCNECKKDVSFIAKNSFDNELELLNSELRHSKLGRDRPDKSFSAFLDKGQVKETIDEDEYRVLVKKGLFFRRFECAHSDENSRHEIFFIFLVKEDCIMKIGQYPSIADLNRKDLDNIRKYSVEIFKELNIAVGLHSHGIGIGAYVYLRRVLEKYIVNPRYEKYIKLENAVPTKSQNVYFKDKVKILKNELSVLLHGSDKLYGFISKGIHELDEDTCKSFFPLIYESILMIVNDEIKITEDENKKVQLIKDINSLS